MIQETVTLNDLISSKANKITDAVDKIAGTFKKVEKEATKVEEEVNFTKPIKNVVKLKSAVLTLGAPFRFLSQKVANFKNKLSGIKASSLSMLKNVLASTIGQFTLASLAAKGLELVIQSIVNGLKLLIQMSDEYAQINARIKLITQNQKEAKALNDAIYYSALRARGSYSRMADAVSKIALTAKHAFPKPEEIVPFVEGIQKLFLVGGTGIQQQKDAMLQLTQALGSGRLQGDEFRSIAEVAPMIEQMVAKTMGVTQGELKALSSQGKITADIIKKSILSNLDEINAKFKKMPMTFGQVWQIMKTVAFRAFVPVFNALSKLVNDPRVIQIGSAIGTGFVIAGELIAISINQLHRMLDLLFDVGTYVFEWIYAGLVAVGDIALAVLPFMTGLVVAYATTWAIANAATLAQIAIRWTLLGLLFICRGAELALAGAINLATIAQAIFNAVLAMNPIAIVIGLVMMACAAFVAWQIHTNGLKNTIKNAFEFIASAAAQAVNFIIDKVNTLINVLNSASSAINSILGTNISKVGTITYHADASSWKSSASGFVDKVSNFKLSSLVPNLTGNIGGGLGYGYGGALPAGALAGGGALDGIRKNGKRTADGIDKLNDTLEITDEDIKYMRDFAEQEAVNKYTTASVNIELGGMHAVINKDVDLDDMVQYVSDSIVDAVKAGAEKVHK